MLSRKNIILIVASTGVFFEALDIAIVNLAMPLIQSDFGLANDEIQWVQTVYIALYGIFLLIGGRLADTIGRRKIFLVGNSIFLLTSLGAALSPDFSFLVICRGIQGIGAALMMPSALSIITNAFTDPQERGKAIGIFGGFAALGSGSGMSVGGLIATWFGWQAVFYMNVPVISLTILLGLLYIPHDTPEKVDRPLIPASILKIRDSLLGAGVMSLLGAFFTGFLFVISMLMQNNMKLTAATAGLILFPFSVLSAISAKTIVPWMMRRMSVYNAGAIGMTLMTIGSILVVASMSLNYNLPLLMLSFACVTGVGMALCFTTLMVITVQSVPEQDHGFATGLTSTLYFLGGGLGLGLLSIVMSNPSEDHQISSAPVVALMMFVIVGIVVLLWFGRKKMSRSEAGHPSIDASVPN